ncbi:glycoside hydrolase family 3 C-terminal domain-containing protein [Sphingomonas nostoxanthinifaciens]|uniref:glycoside hydrolase family 3 C-terminal domain-containing protein n=1 Tax=Sphingomonas nostoxanthinifaciens TaxID=2872652 RepID=UPI001CC1D1F9|nr:glycoside hydrolase family 3 C-terminal domain-containing protein [Sphingomonas nostoxanthinifaciens]UAK25245.1 glycoside hydrolase family 3 C-terminal domain-containing protein [Sphingomonas nostoxanthinifaciens]
MPKTMPARLLMSAAAALLLTGASPPPAPSFRNADLPPDQRIANLLSLMTADEKIDALSTESGVPRLGVPNFGASEGIHGVQQRGDGKVRQTPILTTQFPQPPGLGATWDPDLVRQAAGVEGREARWISQTPVYDRQIMMLWGPQADLARDPRWGRSEEVYGEDPFFNGSMAAAFSRGLEGDDPHYWLAAPLLKHFLANSNENDRTRTSSDFDDRLFWEYYSVPFRMAFQDAGASGVMASYNSWNGVPMAVNPVLRRVVIDQWHVDVVSSDGGAIKTLWKDHHAFPDQETAAVAALKAGVNQYLDVYRDELHAALAKGTITTADLDEALARKFRTTIKLGLLDPPERVPYAALHDGTPPWESDAHRAVSRRAALESLVLLKNDGGALPLRAGAAHSIAVIGPRANNVYWDWYGGFPPYSITPLAGIRAAAGPDVKISYVADDRNNAVAAAAKAADIAVVVVGNDPTCGPDMATAWTDNGTKPCADPGDGREGRDRETLALAQEQLVKTVMAANPRTVMVLVSSFPFTINWSQQNVPAILHMAHSSQDEGWAIGQALFGRYNPGGHEVVTWPASMDQLPPMMDYDIRHGRTYMYFKGKPLFPFGFGLSYTGFRYANLQVDRTHLARDGTATVSVDVTNTGAVAGDAVPQLYVRHPASRVARPPLQLEGFRRVTLAPGETRTVTIPLKAAQLAYWDAARHALTVERERVELMIGASSADIRLRKSLNID